MLQCHYCQLPSTLTINLQSALYEKHCASASFSCLFPIDSILQDDLSPSAVHFRQMAYLSQDHECLKRVYNQSQFPSKISQLSEYYKFSRDLPRLHDPNLVRTMQRYYQKLRELDFRKVKAAVKKEQGISLTSIHSDSSVVDSEEQVKSKYSNVLFGLNEDSHSESHLFDHFCQEINEAFQGSQPESVIKGYFPEQNLRQFEQFIEKQKKKERTFCFKKQKPIPSTDKVHISNKENILKNELNLIRQHSKKSVYKNVWEKTRANDTLSREERSKRMEKNMLLKTADCNNIFRSTLRAFKKKGVPRTLEQIYKGSDQHCQSKYNSAKDKKMSVEMKKKKPSLSKEKKKLQVQRKPKIIENNFILDTERNKEQTRKSMSKTSVHKSIEQIAKRQPSFKVLPQKDKIREREKTLSRSKSRQKMSRQSSRQSVKAKPLTTAQTVSRLGSTLIQQVRLRQDKKIDKLLSKKLALFEM